MSAKVAKHRKMKPGSRGEEEMSEEEEMKVNKYLRGEPVNFEALQDKKLKGQLEVRENFYGESAKAAAKAEKWLMPSSGGYLEVDGIEKTHRILQEDIFREVDILSKRNQFDINSPAFGPYTLDFSLSGRHMITAGRKGHLVLMDMKNLSIVKEMQVRETVRDAVFLHNQKYFATAQKKYVYIYNDSGTELHCLKEHGAASKLQFLNKHFLLTSINSYGQLHFQDITTGIMIGSFRTGLGRSDEMQVNPFNNVLSVGHSGGTVSMWKPTTAAPLVKMLCHQGPVTAIAFHQNGHLMATAGMERKIKLWDLRNYKVIQTLTGHAKSLDFSQKGLLSASIGSSVQVFSDFEASGEYSLYMTHRMVKGAQIQKASFRPYEDVLAIGHSLGWSSILIPGSGEPNFDSWVANPFETRKQRNEKELHDLLDKLPPETIMLDPTKIGSVRPMKKKEKVSKEERQAEMEAAIEAGKSIKIKKKTKGRSKPSKVARKKEEAVAKAKMPLLEQKGKELESARKKRKRIGEDESQLMGAALKRFVRKVPT